MNCSGQRQQFLSLPVSSRCSLQNGSLENLSFLSNHSCQEELLLLFLLGSGMGFGCMCEGERLPHTRSLTPGSRVQFRVFRAPWASIPYQCLLNTYSVPGTAWWTSRMSKPNPRETTTQSNVTQLTHREAKIQS